MRVSCWTICVLAAAVVVAPVSAQESRGGAGELPNPSIVAAPESGGSSPLTFFQLPARTAFDWASSDNREPFSGALALNVGRSRAELMTDAARPGSSLRDGRRRDGPRDRPRDGIAPPRGSEPIPEPAPTDHLTTAPEPSTMVLLGTALLALAAATVIRRARSNRLAVVDPPR